MARSDRSGGLASPSLLGGLEEFRDVFPSRAWGLQLGDPPAQLLGFQDRYNATARPFDWRYTKTDLDAYLDRLSDSAHESIAAAA